MPELLPPVDADAPHGAADKRSERIAQRFERPLIVAAVFTIPVTVLQRVGFVATLWKLRSLS